MPAAYAHLVFGDKVLAQLPEHLRVMIDGSPRSRALYNIGVQGPDFFYFYHLYHPFNSVISLGIQMHHAQAAPFFERARKLLQMQFDPDLYAYLLGFITHFMLDSTCHPYILDRMKKSAATHHEIESEFDRMLMLQDGKDPFTHNPAAYCDASPENCRLIARLFPGITGKQVQKAIQMMKFSCGALRCRSFPKRAVLYNLSCLFQAKGMVLTESVLPRCLMSNRQLYQLVDKAVPETAALIKRYDEGLYDNRPLDRRFKRNYETLQRYR